MVGRFCRNRSAAATVRQQLAQARERTLKAEQDAAALRAENARLAARFDLVTKATSDGLWEMEPGVALTDPATPFWYSGQVKRLLGYGPQDELPNLLGTWASHLHPDDLAPAVAAFVAHVNDRSGATPYDINYRLRCHNGEYRWFRALGHTQRAPDGTALRVAGAVTDITDRNAILSLQRYTEGIVGSLPAGLLVLDASLRVLSANRTFLQICGARIASATLGRTIEQVLPEPGLRAQAQAILDGGAARHAIDVTLGDKRLRVAIAAIDPAEGDRRLLVVAEDVTEEQRLREEARAHAARHRDQASLLDKARDAIIVRGIDGRVQFWNKGAERMYGWCAEEVLGQPVDQLLDCGAPTVDAAGATLAAGEWSGELTHRRKDGELLTVEGHWTLVRDEDNRPKAVLSINTDITARKAADDKIRRLALYDTLTGLPNRTLFAQRLGQALAAAQQAGTGLAVLFMDLNRFKEINDTQGHGVGDQVLAKAARRFQGVLREGETLARLAGDEFVVMAPRVDARAAALIAERLQKALADPVATNGHTFSLGLSIGIALCPADGDTMEDLLKRADIAMYRAKAAGGGHMFYRPEMSVGLAERMELARDLGRAFNDGQLQLYYQPQVCLATGALIGAEVLLRWFDPVRGWVSPARFIPIAESRGMIAPIGKWVLREACAQLQAWRAAGLRFPGRLSVNLAAQQLEEAGIADGIQGIVDAAGLEPECIGLELTESGLMANVERAIGVMATLKEAGYSIAIDDFGTGYSSLAYLKRLPADKLKIDISFVRDMLSDRHDYTIVTTIIGMARNLGLQVIAEGVEQEAQARALLALGCDEAQGYHFGKPEPAEAFARKWLEAGQSR
jgi:diguanylate cyclase (GGDEF)-like protein/PAS domain S-box-containing protein